MPASSRSSGTRSSATPAYAVEARLRRRPRTCSRRSAAPGGGADRDASSEQIARARKAGVEQIYTTNDETNVGMRGVNERLGYRPAPTRILAVSGPLAT